jgi:hypothetical protein
VHRWFLHWDEATNIIDGATSIPSAAFCEKAQVPCYANETNNIICKVRDTDFAAEFREEFARHLCEFLSQDVAGKDCGLRLSQCNRNSTKKQTSLAPHARALAYWAPGASPAMTVFVSVAF